MIPSTFRGGWQRRSLRLGDGPPHENAAVAWLQGTTHFADLRVPSPDAVVDEGRPAHPEMAFAGTTAWDGAASRLHWTHLIDMGDEEVEDGGEVHFVDDLLVETGVFVIDGAEVPYVEEWERLPGAEGPLVVALSPSGLLLRTGDHALVLVDERPDGGVFAAARMLHTDAGWRTTTAVGGEADLPQPPDPDGDLDGAPHGPWELEEAIAS